MCPAPGIAGWGRVDGFMPFDTESGREVVKIEGRKLWIEDLRAEESGVICIILPPIQVDFNH